MWSPRSSSGPPRLGPRDLWLFGLCPLLFCALLKSDCLFNSHLELSQLKTRFYQKHSELIQFHSIQINSIRGTFVEQLVAAMLDLWGHKNEPGQAPASPKLGGCSAVAP